MATNNSIYGLISAGNKGKFSLQSLQGGQVADDSQAPSDQVSPWAAAPLRNAPVPQATATLTPAQIAANFQWTGQYDAQNRALQQQESDAGLQRTNSLAQIAANFLDATRQAESDYTKGRRKQFEGLADRGIITSSPALETMTQYDTDYNNYLQKLADAKAYDSMSAENSYVNILNNIGRQREGLAAAQQQEEEARKIEQARLQAEAERQAREEQQRAQQIQQLIAAQEQARLAAEQAQQAALAATYSYSAPGGGYDFGGGGGGYYEDPGPAPKPVEQAPVQDMVVMPAFNNGVTQQAVESWIKKNVDPNLTGTALAKVREALAYAGPRGVSRSDLAWLISQYPTATRQTVTARSAPTLTAKIK